MSGFDGDVLNVLTLINNAFIEACEYTFNPRNAMYISRNNGLFNHSVCVQRDSIINANTLLNLGRKYIDNDEKRVNKIKKILANNEKVS
jgi:hypothetical protein